MNDTLFLHILEGEHRDCTTSPRLVVFGAIELYFILKQLKLVMHLEINKCSSNDRLPMEGRFRLA